MKKLILIFYIIFPGIVFSQPICAELDYSKISKPYIEKENDFKKAIDKHFGEQAAKNSGNYWTILPIVKINPVKNSKGGIEFNVDTTSSALIIRNADKSMYEYNLKFQDEIRGLASIKSIWSNFDSVFIKKSFIAYFLDEDRQSYETILYCSENNINFRNNSGNVYLSISSVVENKFGSVQKYLELFQEEKEIKAFEQELWPHNINEASDLLKSYWKLRSSYVPTDTAGNLKLFLNSVSNSVNISSDQKSLLEFKIMNYINQMKGFDFSKVMTCHNEYTFYNMDLYPIINTVLTEDQLLSSKRYFTALSKSFIHAQNIIYTDCLNVKPKANEEFKQLYQSRLMELFQ